MEQTSIVRDPPAVILGGRVTALSVARSLWEAGISVYVLDRRDSPVRMSRQRTAFVDVSGSDTQGRMLDWLQTAPAGAVVLAASDDGLELIVRHRTDLVGRGLLPMEANDDVLLAMLSKRRTYELANAHEIATPNTILLRTFADVEDVAGELTYPCVLKPTHSHLFQARANSSVKALVIGGPTELRAEFERLQSLGVEMLVTEVICGPNDEFVSYYSYIDNEGTPLLHFTKRKIRQHPLGFGIGTYHATTHDPEVAELGRRFFEAVGLRGLGNVEFKRDGRDGRLKLIECNARFTASNELIRRSGVDLALFSYNRLTGRPTPPVDAYRDDMRLWEPVSDTLAFLLYRRRGELTFAGWVRSLAHRQCFPAARLSDPLPAIVRHAEKIKRVRGREGQGPPSTGPSGARAASAVSPSRRAWRRDPMRLLERLAGLGRPGRALAARVDLVGAAGSGYYLRRARDQQRFARLGEGARNALYERIWREAAMTVGAQAVSLAPGLLELSRGAKRTRVYQQAVALDDPVTLRVALDKVLVHRLLVDAQVTSPEHVEFRFEDPAPALAFLARAGGACVVKPAAGTGGGHGTTAGITRPADLLRARVHAAKSTDRLLVERQAPGAVYRLLLLDGELLDVVRNTPARLTGDGRSTIAKLMRAVNERRVAARGAAGLARLGVDLDLVLTLERAGLSLSSVPTAGRTVAIRTITNDSGPEQCETYAGPVADGVVAEARAAAEAVGLALAGVDVITPDPARSLREVGGVIIEVNGTPGLHHHYLVADPERATRVAVPILERLLRD
jgi:D-aspartate ligase